MLPKMITDIQEIVDTSYSNAKDLKEGMSEIWNQLRKTYPHYLWNVVADPVEVLSDDDNYAYIKVLHNKVLWRRFFVLGSTCFR